MEDKPIDKPFSEEDLQKAKKLARDSHIVLEGDQKSGFIGTCAEMPTVMNDGETDEECIEKTRESIQVAIAFMLEEGMKIPKPNSRKK